MRALFMCLWLAGCGLAQQIFSPSSGGMVYVSSDPSGSCSVSYITVNSASGAIEGCIGGTWTAIGGGGGASVTTGTSAPSGTCTAGALYARTDMKQFYVCAATNTWVVSSYQSAAAASRPVNCVAGQIYLATDTGAMTYCSTPGSPGTWSDAGANFSGGVTALYGGFGSTPAVGGTLRLPNGGAVTARNFTNSADLGLFDTTSANVFRMGYSNIATLFTGATFFQVGGNTSSFPGLKRSGAALAVRLADDSADAALTAGSITASGPISTMTGAAASKPATCTVGQEYFANDATAGQNKYFCTATNTWTQQTGAVLTSVVPSGTAITYSVSTSSIQVFSVTTLAANILTNTMTATSATAGQIIQWIYTQNGSGAFTVTHPSNLLGACTVDPTANITTIVTAVWDGTNAQATGCTTNVAGLVVAGTEIAARATPAAGTAVCWPDSTDHSGLECKANNSASVFKLVLSGVDINPVTGQVTATHLAAALPVAQGGTGLTSGTSGGVLAYTASGTIASSGALQLNAPLIGGGAGSPPSYGVRSGNTIAFVTTTGTQTSGDCVKIDANGNHVALGTPCGAIVQPVPITLFTTECQGAATGMAGSYQSPNPTASCNSSGTFGWSQFSAQPAADECRTQLIQLPSDFTTSTTPTVEVNWATAATTNSVTWSIATAPSATGTVADSASYNTVDTVAHAPQGTTLQWRSDSITLTNGVTSLTASKLVTVKICRVHTDTTAAVVNLINARLTYYVNR